MNHSITSRRAEEAHLSCGESEFSKKKESILRKSGRAGTTTTTIVRKCEGRYCRRVKGSCKNVDKFSSFSCLLEATTVSWIKSLRKYSVENVDRGGGGGNMESSGTTAVLRTFLWLFLCLLFVTGTLAAEPLYPPSACKYPDPVEFAAVKPTTPPRGGIYLNGSKAHVDCYSNFRVKSGNPQLTCVDGNWVGADGRTVECELIPSHWAPTCGQPPTIDRGFYGSPKDEPAENTAEGYPTGTELQADCISTFTLNCTHPYQNICGRISCQPDGRWVPKDGNLVTGCVAKPALLTVNGDDDRHGPRPSSSLKNYLILALALVCIFVVGALTIALLRRPLFYLDSLPVAMNTGIFLPGAAYDMQDCQMQDVPFVGTTVFK